MGDVINADNKNNHHLIDNTSNIYHSLDSNNKSINENNNINDKTNNIQYSPKSKNTIDARSKSRASTAMLAVGITFAILQSALPLILTYALGWATGPAIAVSIGIGATLFFIESAIYYFRFYKPAYQKKIHQNNKPRNGIQEDDLKNKLLSSSPNSIIGLNEQIFNDLDKKINNLQPTLNTNNNQAVFNPLKDSFDKSDQIKDINNNSINSLNLNNNIIESTSPKFY
jgi:hypothetical protein